MDILDIIILVFCLLVLMCVLCLFFYKYFNYNISRVIFKIDDANESINNKLKDKYELIHEIIKFCEEKFSIKSKTFNNISKIKNENISYESDKLFNKAFEEISNIIDDNQKSKEINELKKLIKNYDNNELYIVSLRTYYNRNVLYYNSLIRKFPYVIIAKIKGYKLYMLFDGEELPNDEEHFIEV